HGATPSAVQRTCVLKATAAKDGLYASASRCVSFGEPDPEFRREFEAACRLGAVCLAQTRPGVLAAEAAQVGKAFLAGGGSDHAWRGSPPGYVTGRTAAELPLSSPEPVQAGWAVAWLATVGAAAGGDTCLVTPDGAQVVTPCEDWPVRRVRVQTVTF